MSYGPPDCRTNAVGGRANGHRSRSRVVLTVGRAWEAFGGCLPPDGPRTTAQGAGGANALLAAVGVGEFDRAEAG
jgi:hypothetical protein